MAGDGAPGGLDTSFDNDHGWAEEMKTIEDCAYQQKESFPVDPVDNAPLEDEILAIGPDGVAHDYQENGDIVNLGLNGDANFFGEPDPDFSPKAAAEANKIRSNSYDFDDDDA